MLRVANSPDTDLGRKCNNASAAALQIANWVNFIMGDSSYAIATLHAYIQVQDKSDYRTLPLKANTVGARQYLLLQIHIIRFLSRGKSCECSPHIAASTMNKEKTIFRTAWITVKETARGFHYLERKGRDSVAIFLVRKSNLNRGEYEVLIRQQPLCIDVPNINEEHTLYPCPITGGIDEGELPEEAAVREVYEEAGFSVQVLPLGKYIVGTQTNEICYLYYADVTSIEPEVAPQDGSYFESISKNEWYPLDYLNQCDYSACQIGYFRLKNILL